MAVTAGILKVVVSSYRIDSETVLSVTEATLPVMMQRNCPENMAFEILT